MTAYELATLYQTNLDANITVVSVWIGITFSVIIAAYFTGPRLSLMMTWFMAFTYSIWTASIFSAEYSYILRLEMIEDDMARLHPAAMETVTVLQTYILPTGQLTSIVIGWVAIWVGAVFFIFHARKFDSISRNE
ncbi:MAG: hypothetical protein E2O92_08845 [Alphaproteobacteria bacterium]|nr:MAG: hypothetical protein E2O92_08845 [Alphaproteobacteria bacterium]